MAIQSELYGLDGTTRTYPSTKHIASKANMAIWLQLVTDGTWVQLEPEKYELINNSAVLVSAPSVVTYGVIEIRVADTADELTSDASAILIVASIYNEVVNVSSISTEVVNVGGITTEIVTVANGIDNVAAILLLQDDMATIVSISDDITAVSGIEAAVSNVSGISADIVSLSSISTDITSVSTNMASVIAAASLISIPMLFKNKNISGTTIGSTGFLEEQVYSDTSKTVYTYDVADNLSTVVYYDVGGVTALGTETLTYDVNNYLDTKTFVGV